MGVLCWQLWFGLFLDLRFCLLFLLTPDNRINIERGNPEKLDSGLRYKHPTLLLDIHLIYIGLRIGTHTGLPIVPPLLLPNPLPNLIINFLELHPLFDYILAARLQIDTVDGRLPDLPDIRAREVVMAALVVAEETGLEG